MFLQKRGKRRTRRCVKVMVVLPVVSRRGSGHRERGASRGEPDGRQVGGSTACPECRVVSRGKWLAGASAGGTERSERTRWAMSGVFRVRF